MRFIQERNRAQSSLRNIVVVLSSVFLTCLASPSYGEAEEAAELDAPDDTMDEASDPQEESTAQEGEEGGESESPLELEEGAPSDGAAVVSPAEGEEVAESAAVEIPVERSGETSAAASSSVQTDEGANPWVTPTTVEEGDALEASDEAEPGLARRWHLRATTGVGPSFVPHDSFDIIEEKNTLVLWQVAGEFEWTVRGVAPIVFQVGYSGGSARGRLFDSFDTQLKLHSLELAVMGGYRFWDTMMPYLRAGLSVTWTDVSFESGNDELTAADTALGAFVFTGLELSLARRWIRRAFRTQVFTLGLRIEGGFTYSGTFTFDAHQVIDDDDDDEDDDDDDEPDYIAPHFNSALGTLLMIGGALRFSIVLSF